MDFGGEISSRRTVLATLGVVLYIKRKKDESNHKMPELTFQHENSYANCTLLNYNHENEVTI